MSELEIFKKAGAAEEISKFIDPRNQGSKEEHRFFFEICKSRDLNPFTKEVYFIKYGSQNAAIVIGVDTFISRANEHHDYMGFKSGWIIINEEGKAVKTEIPHGRLYGAWCEIHRKDKVTLTQTVVFSEYSTGKNRWQSAPFQMIDKVAQATAHRKAYPKSFQHLYGWEEMDQAKDGVKIQGKVDDIVDPSDSLQEEDTQEEAPTSHVALLTEKLSKGKPDTENFTDIYLAPELIFKTKEEGTVKFLMQRMLKTQNLEALRESWNSEVNPKFEELNKDEARELVAFKDLMKDRINADKTMPFSF